MELDVQGAAALLRVSTKTIYRWVGDNRIPGYRVNHRFRFDRAELLEWATANRMAVNGAQEPDGRAPLPSFDEALASGGIHYRVEGADRDSVLANVAQVMRVEVEAERDLVAGALRAREDLASTAVGGGFAIPHLRNPLRLHLDRATVTLCFLEKPVDWSALDGEPVSALLVVIGSTVRTVLQLHSRCLFALREEAFRSAVHTQQSREALLAAARQATAGFHLPRAT